MDTTPVSNHKTRVGNPLVRHRVGGWLPSNHRVLEKWLEQLVAQIDRENKSSEDLHPVIQDFQSLIENDVELYKGFHEMFQQVPRKPPYNNDPTLKPQIRDYKVMLRAFDRIIGSAPVYKDNDLVGFPINAILDWPMGTKAGLATFLNPKLNLQFKKMFDVWAQYLQSPDSRSVLTSSPNGWFGEAASQAMPNFAQLFVCDPSAEYHGFASWDDFFTRRFQSNVRPILFPNDDRIINSACESSVYRISHGVKLTDEFWLKDEPYSLEHMLDGDERASQFVGGTIYQAFLSALNYHRWASPVNGTVVETKLIPGTFYAESPETGFPDPDPSGPNRSQGYITSIAARAVIFIEANEPTIGLMAFVAVGMAEVSTCDIGVRPGDRVRKGDDIGMFHFGGSTHCLLFRPETKVIFEPQYTEFEAPVLLSAPIAHVE